MLEAKVGQNTLAPNNLPVQLTSFVGREKEIVEVKRLLANTRLLTLTGIGGAGKTRLSLRVATDLLTVYADGVWFADLANLTPEHGDSSEYSVLVPQTVAAVLGLREKSNLSLLEALTDHIGLSQMLIVLDNCEHLVEASSTLADALLRACPNLRILATSRQGLSVAGEVVWPVPPLSAPDPQETPLISSLLQCDAVQLFVGRASLRKPNFALTPGNAQAIARLCSQLDGIPLAIELAAARVNVLTPESIVAKLDERLRLLSSHSQTVPRRHQTLVAMMDWSYDLLSEPERILFGDLSIFAGSFTADAVREISGSGSKAGELLSSLADKSLVITEQDDRQLRYRLLETVRQYAWQKLQASTGAHDASYLRGLQARHARWYLDIAERSEPQLHGPEQTMWLHRLETEYDNLRAALQWSVSSDVGPEVETEQIEIGLRISASLRSFWAGRGYWSEARKWLDTMLSRSVHHPSSGTTPSPYSLTLLSARAKALQAAGWLANSQNDYTQGTALLTESLELSRHINFTRGIADALHGLAWVSFVSGNYDQVKLFGEEGLTLHKQLGDEQTLIFALEILGFAAMGQEELERAADLFAQSLEVAKRLDNKGSIASLLGSLGEVARAQGDFSGAGSLYREALQLSREARNRNSISVFQANLGSVAYRLGDLDVAQSAFTESFELALELGDKLTTIHCMVGLAGVLEARKQPLIAAQLLGCADGLLDELGTQLELADRMEHEYVLQVVRTRLGDAASNSEQMKGRTMTPQQAIDLALQQHAPGESAVVEAVRSPAQDSQSSTGTTTDKTNKAQLTKRELEILRLIGEGLTNPEIAGELSLTVHTVEAHLRSVYSKIGVKSRYAAAHYAHINKLTK